MKIATTSILPVERCGIATPVSDLCTAPLGHLGRCTWDHGPAVDPIYEEHTTANLLNPLAMETNIPVDAHGTRWGYTHGCHCLVCRAANADYLREYRAARR